MKRTLHGNGHRWTPEEVEKLMRLWAQGASPGAIGEEVGASTHAVLRMVQRLRKEGVPLERRTRGNHAGRNSKLWTQGEVEYLVRRRSESATIEEIAIALGRSWNGVSAMLAKLRSENVPVAMYGQGRRRLWDAAALIATATQDPEAKIIALDEAQARRAAG